MPPRYVYWTILIDHQPTAFRAKVQEDLLPTFNQLRRTNTDVVMKWFARGKLWESPEAERAAQRTPTFREKRGPEWRPGGAHEDPRARFAKRKRSDRRPPRDDKPSADAGQASRPAGSRPDAEQASRPARHGPDVARSFRPAGPRPKSAAVQASRPARHKPDAGQAFRPAGFRPAHPRPHPRRDRRQ